MIEPVDDSVRHPLNAPQRFTGRQDFAAALRHTLARAAAESWPSITLADADFADWPLHERATIELLDAWAHSRRSMVLFARDWRHVQAAQHRFVTWRQRWQHIVTAWACPAVGSTEFPSVLLGPAWVVQRLDPARSVGVCDSDAQRIGMLQERLAEITALSGKGFPAQVLGL